MYVCMYMYILCPSVSILTLLLHMIVLGHITVVFPLCQDDLHPEDVLPPRILKKIKPKHVSACILHHVL